MTVTQKRIAVLSDIHGNLPALTAVVADFTQRGIDDVVVLGDSFSGPLWPQETAEFLMAQSWTHIAGNHERQILTLTKDQTGPSDNYARAQLAPNALTWIAKLPTATTLADEIFLCHGTPANDKEYFLETIECGRLAPASATYIQEQSDLIPTPVILCGHTHIPRSVRTVQGQLIVNPGSVGLPAFTDIQPIPHKAETGSPDSRYAIIEKKQNRWTVQLLTVPYDHRPMAELAKQRGRREWQSALLTGYVDLNE